MVYVLLVLTVVNEIILRTVCGGLGDQSSNGYFPQWGQGGGMGLSPLRKRPTCFSV